ncbi:GNAT family N-acetyltransferase [Allosphingosinicella deserti]|nr:GNAT family N-acetyltransferase [Sphingomonas deserti]
MQEAARPIASAVAVDVAIVAGVPDEIDLAAARADSAHLFLRRAWYEAAGHSGVRTVIAARPDGAVIAALPTAPTRWPGMRLVPGSYWPFRSFPVDADIADSELAAMLSSSAVRKALGPVWRMGPVYENDPTLIRLLRICAGSGWTPLPRRIAPSFLLDIDRLQADGSWPRGSTLRKNRFHEKHLATHGDLEWRFVSGAGWTSEVFDDLAEIERRSWVADRTDGSDAKFMAPHHRRVWEGAAADPVLAEAMRAAILYIGGAPAAFSFDLDAGSIKYAIANSYDERFAKHSPGKCLYYRNLVEAMERGIAIVDWGAGDSGYKRTIGADEGPGIVDLLFVGNAALARVIAPIWRRSGRKG